MLRPPNFHRHRGGWLPPNQHRHRGVLQCSRRSLWALFPQNSQNCPSRPQSSESSKCHVISSRHLISRKRSRGAWAWMHGESSESPPPCGIHFPTPKRQHRQHSRDRLGTVLSETVVTISLSAPPMVPCSEQLAHSRTAGTICIWKPRIHLFQINNLALTPTDIRHRQRHRHLGGVSRKTPPPTKLQIPATVTTLVGCRADCGEMLYSRRRYLSRWITQHIQLTTTVRPQLYNHIKVKIEITVNIHHDTAYL